MCVCMCVEHNSINPFLSPPHATNLRGRASHTPKKFPFSLWSVPSIFFLPAGCFYEKKRDDRHNKKGERDREGGINPSQTN